MAVYLFEKEDATKSTYTSDPKAVNILETAKGKIEIASVGGGSEVR